MASFLNPKPTNPIIPDVDQIHDLLNVLAQFNPALADGIPEGAKRLYEYTENGKTLFRFEKYVKGAWVALGAMDVDAKSVGGYAPSTTAKANAIPVYNSSSQLVGNITGNAPTATKLATPRSIQVGGIASSTAQNFDGTSNVTIPINSITLNNAADNAVNGVLTPAHGGSGRTDGVSLDVVVPSLSGNVLAKAYGQIGNSKQINNTVNLDTFIVDGNYYFRGNNVNASANHWPNGGNDVVNSLLSVYWDGTTNIKQILIGGTSGGAWRRVSSNKGASWTSWVPLDLFTNCYTIYISKSGNDNNSGLDSSYPVLTAGRAFQIAESVHRQGNGQPYVYFNFGEGNWGNITIRDCPFLLIFRPYDGGSATAYSTTLPVFGNITVENSYFWFQTCVAGKIIAQHGSGVQILTGYKRVASLSSLYNSLVYIAPQNAATNLIDFTGGNNIPLEASYGGIIYAQYVHLRLCGNLTTHFLYEQMLGRITVHNGQTIYDTTSFSNSGKKYALQHGSMFNSGQTNGNLSWLNALPGAQAGTVDDSCYINGRAMANVLKTGDTMTGTLTLKVNGVQINAYDTGFSRSAAPAANLYRRSYQMWDAQNVCSGAIQAGFTTAQRMHMGIFAQRVISGVTKYAEIGGWINNDGTFGGYAPTPASGSNTNDIATTAWVRTYHAANSSSSGSASTVNNGTLNNTSFASGTINHANVKLTGTPPFTGNDDRLPNLYWVNNLCARLFYGMCPVPTISTSTYKYNTWYSAASNGWILCSFTGAALQYWRVGKSTSSYNSLNAGTVDSAFTLPVQYRTYFYVYDSLCSGEHLGWMQAIAQHGWNGSRPDSRANDEIINPGMGRIFLRIIGGEIVEGFGDLLALADNLGLEVPDPNRLEFDSTWITDFYNDGLAKIEADYEAGVAAINEQFENELKLALFDAERMIDALYKERGAEAFELPYEEEFHFTRVEIERQIDAEKGGRLVTLLDIKKKAYKDLEKELAVKQSEFEDACQREIEETYRLRDAVCEKAAAMADMIIDIDTWDENYCAAHLEDGKIVLGPGEKVLAGFIERLSEKRLQKYDREVMRLEREKRLAVRAARQRGNNALAKYAGREAEIEERLAVWDMYAAEIADLPNKKGFPWDGGKKATPWPEEPVFEEDA